MKVRDKIQVYKKRQNPVRHESEAQLNLLGSKAVSDGTCIDDMSRLVSFKKPSENSAPKCLFVPATEVIRKIILAVAFYGDGPSDEMITRFGM